MCPSLAKLTWSHSGFARDPKYSWFHEHSKNHFLNNCQCLTSHDYEQCVPLSCNILKLIWYRPVISWFVSVAFLEDGWGVCFLQSLCWFSLVQRGLKNQAVRICEFITDGLHLPGIASGPVVLYRVMPLSSLTTLFLSTTIGLNLDGWQASALLGS